MEQRQPRKTSWGGPAGLEETAQGECDVTRATQEEGIVTLVEWCSEDKQGEDRKTAVECHQVWVLGALNRTTLVSGSMETRQKEFEENMWGEEDADDGWSKYLSFSVSISARLLWAARIA